MLNYVVMLCYVSLNNQLIGHAFCTHNQVYNLAVKNNITFATVTFNQLSTHGES